MTSSSIKTILFSLVLATSLVGCASKHKLRASAPGQKPTPERPLVVPANSSTGRVAKVSKAARFVILSYAIGSEPVIGQRLNVYRDNLKVAELKVTGPQREGNTVADITTGEVQVDDEVRED